MANIGIKSKCPPLTQPEIIFLSVFGLGKLPFAPGTWASLATVPFLYLLMNFKVPLFFLFPLFTIVTAASCFVAHYAQEKYQQHDPSWIVIDEVLGMIAAWFFCWEQAAFLPFLIFALFRFFDIVKIWPASYFDRQVKHGAGTILDDIVSGIMAGLTYRFIYFIFTLTT